MKRIFLTTALFSVMLLGGTIISHAADTNANSTAKILLEASETENDPSVPIVNPDDNDGQTNDPTGNTGSLRIDYISNIDFGKQTIAATNKTYTAVKPNNKVLAQVTDLRGSGAGWILQVNYDGTNGFVDDTKILKGAVLSLPAGEAATTTDNVSSDQPATTNALEVNNSAQTIMSATANTGLGVWGDKMDPAAVKLAVPAGNLAGNYTATLVWTLSDAPA
ncbi:WxL domain-containing protein [Enterococcus dongliensis]|uniref:WxL domain-containing protein n=1 Tax=Enterococcus dongliensis TaxID=2559925 RepID=A0AAW8TH48_9ENTE|nr:WxL domain-containing protein [Enterococcus dongliensis]MDT2596755.1 WxL domain-containing protein [Enterococcus dongliensis]MDT2604596.1 WxL domain-containing protein [Enterococcus dongliensis]MDT2635116.1 WxL domain-containing protein [Enterococcus dongliensis]MDT2636555.1 WxL domain-containing protein [Enterococcus dongliensis]MDT2640733.1 WxL domain-containing protein [Enterococcus dongliensis]